MTAVTLPSGTTEQTIDLTSAPGGGALERIALALNSTLELREVLRALAAETLATAGAGRATIFVLDNGALHPAVSRGSVSDVALREAFAAMPPIELTPERAAAIQMGSAVVLHDPAETGLCPREWIDRFDVRCLVLVPLLAGGEPCGLMTIDFPERRSLSRGELATLEAVGSFAGVAVRNARTYEAARRTARLQAGLARAAATLASPLRPEEVAGRLCAAATDLLDARRSIVVSLGADDTTVSPVIACGVDAAIEPADLADVPPLIRDTLTTTWTESPGRACRFDGSEWLTGLLGGGDAGLTRHLVIPLLTKGSPSGAAVLAFDRSAALDAEALSAAEGLAAIAGAAMERHALLERQEQQVLQLDILYRLSTALAERADAGRLTATLNNLLAPTGLAVTGMAFKSRALIRHLGGDTPTAAERDSWRAGGGPGQLPDGCLSVPMRAGRSVIGSLRVRPAALSPRERAFVEALAAGVADVVHRGALREAVEEAGRERAITAERERIAADLHDTVGQQFVAVGLMANRLVEQLPPGSPFGAKVARLAEIAASGKFETDQAVRALAFVPSNRRGLVPALKGLCRSIAEDSGLDVIVEVSRSTNRIAAGSARALYRVAFEALTNAWRHAHCSTVSVQLMQTADAVTLRVRDDGIGLGSRSVGDLAGTGTWSMRRTMAEVDGRLRIRAGHPRGVEVTATVARHPR